MEFTVQANFCCFSMIFDVVTQEFSLKLKCFYCINTPYLINDSYTPVYHQCISVSSCCDLDLTFDLAV